MTIINIYMKRLLNAFKSAKGFTLIELLVVIGILGILAAALIATIDPFEQLKKANDTNTTNTLVEFLNASTRYYTTHNAFPWETGGAGCTAPAASGDLLSSAAPKGLCWIQALTSDNELKQAFSGSSSLQYINISYNSGTKVVTGCFNPTSKSLLHNSLTKWDSTGTNDLSGGICSAASKDSNPTSCYWCTR